MKNRRCLISVLICFCIRIQGALAYELPAVEMQRRFAGEKAAVWGEHLEGVVEGVKTDEKVLALTFDACGGAKKSGDYDGELISFLIKHDVPATLFLNARWIDAHKDEFAKLADNPLFEIGNHGTRHLPLSTTGRGAYGIKGTADIGEVFWEVESNARKIEALTGKKPRWFRSGTANYDDVAVRIVSALGYRVAGFRVNADSGGTASAEQVKRALLSAETGSVVLAHMNRPQSGTREGVRLAVPLLLKKGFRFVTLSELIPDNGTNSEDVTGARP